MVQHSETIDTSGLDANAALALVHGTFQQLGWTVQFIDADRYSGFTKKTWGQPVDLITVRALPAALEVTSALPNAALDRKQTNAKKVQQFLAAWAGVSGSATDAQRSEWSAFVADVQQRTAAAIEAEKQEAAALDAVMPEKEKGAITTIGIAGVNVLVFILMWIGGVGFFEPAGEGLLRWGANFPPYTLDGQAWRLLTCIFVHVGVVHLVMNMYALFLVGTILEPMLGWKRYLAAYLATGLLASLTSLWWHPVPRLAAGASGAIMGLFGVFVALLTTKLVPPRTRASLLRGFLVYIGITLLYGLKQGVDNAAHLGGVLSGFVLGYAFLPFLKPERRRSPVPVLVAALLSVGICLYYLYRHPYDTRAFERADKVVSAHRVKALNLPDSLGGSDYANLLATQALPEWKAAEQELKVAAGYRLLPYQQQRRSLLNRYVQLRLRETELLIRMNRGDSTANAPFAQVSAELNSILEALSGQAK
ncbi:rhomboid family intramembrane serine protease [Flaviaesturariibacter amylovorans]|uniref:Peptidase S54 rhomboid domain-containing protein n=1 Tax=Flaviaesturariibacter amylovorans TaxID=1084520 RepID=A0ABP8HGH7_9BACT